MGQKLPLNAACLILGGLLFIAFGGTAQAQDRQTPGAAANIKAASGMTTGLQVAQDRRRRRPGNRNHIMGRATAVDGDTIEIRGRRIRLHGIDAFQTRQRCRTSKGRRYRCGRRAGAAMQQLVNGQRIACVRLGGGRNATVATCWR